MKVLKRLGLILSALLVAACQRAGAPSSPVTGAPGQMTSVRASQVIVEGSSSGGGSFGDESSLTILRWASEDLSMQIRNASPEIFAQLPAGWTQERLANVIANVQPTVANLLTYQIPERNYYGQRVMFDYRDKTKTEEERFITATKLFTDAYASYEVNTRPKHEFRATIEEVKLKLAHEAAHLMGLGLSREADMPEARLFAKRLLESLETDNVECMPHSPLPVEAYTAFETHGLDSLFASKPRERLTVEQKEKNYLAKVTRAYVFNRPTGKGAAPSSIGAGNCEPILTIDEAQGAPRGTECAPSTDYAKDTEHISVARDFSRSFTLTKIREAIFFGRREYHAPEVENGYFNWNTIDLRKAVLTEDGYRSDYKYEMQKDLNDYFVSYLDYRVLKSTARELELETLPAELHENWNFSRSRGQALIRMSFTEKGQIKASNLILTKAFNVWSDKKVKEQPIHIEVPLACVRSFKPLEVPKPQKQVAAKP